MAEDELAVFNELDIDLENAASQESWSPDAAFDMAAGKLKDAGLGVYCFGSTIMNWQKTVQTPFDVTRIAITNPAIADATVVRQREILIDGKAPGTVTLPNHSPFVVAERETREDTLARIAKSGSNSGAPGRRPARG